MRSACFAAIVFLLLFGTAGVAASQVGAAASSDASRAGPYAQTTPQLISFEPVGEAGAIAIYKDAVGPNCGITLPAAGQMVQLYVVQTRPTMGITGVEFSAPRPSCFNGTWLDDTNSFAVVIGNTQTGISVGYGACMTNSTLIVTMSFLVEGTTEPCCVYPVLPNPVSPSGRIEMADCDFNLRYGTGAHAVLNPTAACMCGETCAQPYLALQGYSTVSLEDPYWTVQVVIENLGPAEARHVSATMHEDIPWLSVPDPVCYYGHIPSGGCSWGDGDDYVLDLTNYSSGTFNVWFDVSYEDTCGYTHTVRLDPEFDSSSGANPLQAVTTLGQNYPNPFNPGTTIPVFLAAAGEVNLSVFDCRGRLVRVLVDRPMPAGSTEVHWDGRDMNGAPVGSGVYFCRFKSADALASRKLILLK